MAILFLSYSLKTQKLSKKNYRKGVQRMAAFVSSIFEIYLEESQLPRIKSLATQSLWEDSFWRKIQNPKLCKSIFFVFTQSQVSYKSCLQNKIQGVRDNPKVGVYKYLLNLTNFVVVSICHIQEETI